VPKHIDWPPKFRPVNPAGSVWDKVSQGPSKSWTHWPNPFPYLKDMQVLACEDRITLRLWFWGAIFGRWVFSNFVPSPVELTRKTISGGYKCGFYLDPGFGSPLDLIWEDKSVSQAVLEINRPFVETLFYLWAMQTVWSGMSAAHHAYLAVERCGAALNEVILVGGSGDWNFSPESGSPVGFQTAYDPLHRYDGISSIQFFAGQINGFACGYVSANGCDVSSARVYIRSAVYSGDVQEIGPIPNFGTRAFAIDISKLTSLTQDFEIRMDVIKSPATVGRAAMVVTRFIMSYGKEPHPAPTTPLKIADPCFGQNINAMSFENSHHDV